MYFRIISLCTCALLFSACRGPISKESMALVDPALSVSAVREDPERYRGKFLIVPGMIALTSNSDDGGEIEIVQFPASSSGRPDPRGISQGRVLAISDGFLDPLVYRRGEMVTVVGEVEGEEDRSLDETEYSYPVIRIREIHLWRPDEGLPPSIHFGIGVGTVF